MEKLNDFNDKLSSELKEDIKNRIMERVRLMEEEIKGIEDATNQQEEEEKEDINEEIKNEEKKEVIQKEKSKQEDIKNEIKQEVNKPEIIQEIKKPEIKQDVKKPEIKQEIKKPEIQQEVKKEKTNELTASIFVDKEKIKETIKRLNERLDEYREAIDYFVKIDQTEKIDETREKAKKLDAAIKALKRGEEIDEFSLPIKITPDFICGMTREEKLEKYKEIVKYYLTREKDQKHQLSVKKNYFQSLKKSEVQKKLGQMKKELDSYVAEAKRCEEMVKKLKVYMGNPWMPVPLFEKKEEQELIEVKNDEIAENTILIQISKVEGQKYGDLINIILPGSVNEMISLATISPSEQFLYNQSIHLEKQDMKHLSKKTIDVFVYQKGCCSNKLIGQHKMKLIDFAEHCTVKSDCAIDNGSGAKENLLSPKIEIQAKIKKALGGAEFTTITKETMEITRVYPPFREVQVQQQPQSKIQAAPKKKAPPQEKPPVIIGLEDKHKPLPPKKGNVNIELNEVPKTDEPKKENPEPKSDKPEPKIDKSEFTPNELVDPDQLDQLNALCLLQNKADQLKAKIAKIEGRTPKALKQLSLSVNVKLKQMTECIETGEINIDQYLTIIQNCLAHDKKLFLYFKQNNEKDKMEIMKKRVELLIKEIKDIEQCKKGQ